MENDPPLIPRWNGWHSSKYNFLDGILGNWRTQLIFLQDALGDCDSSGLKSTSCPSLNNSPGGRPGNAVFWQRQLLKGSVGIFMLSNSAKSVHHLGCQLWWDNLARDITSHALDFCSQKTSGIHCAQVFNMASNAWVNIGKSLQHPKESSTSEMPGFSFW